MRLMTNEQEGQKGGRRIGLVKSRYQPPKKSHPPKHKTLIDKETG